MIEVQTIDAFALAAERTAGENLFLLDVREPHEAALCRIEGSTLIPLAQLAQRLAEIPPNAEIVAYCHHGRRSEKAIQYLQTQGFSRLRNLTGGIDAWAVAVDPAMARY